MDLIHELLNKTIRTFYDAKSVIVYDLLMANAPLSEEQLTAALKERQKDFSKVLAKLRMDKLIKCETRLEPAINDFKKRNRVSKSYYYIDYAHTVDVIKYRIYKIGRIIEQELQDQMNNLPYVCQTTSCQKDYNALDMLTLETNKDKIPICEICGGELMLDSKGSDSTGASEKYTRFVRETKPIIELLKKTDSLVIPETKIKLTMLDGMEPKDINAPGTMEPPNTYSQVVVEIEQVQVQERDQSTNYLDSYYASLVDSKDVLESKEASAESTSSLKEDEKQELLINQGMMMNDEEEEEEEEEEFIEA